MNIHPGAAPAAIEAGVAAGAQLERMVGREPVALQYITQVWTKSVNGFRWNCIGVYGLLHRTQLALGRRSPAGFHKLDRTTGIGVPGCA